MKGLTPHLFHFCAISTFLSNGESRIETPLVTFAKLFSSFIFSRTKEAFATSASLTLFSPLFWFHFFGKRTWKQKQNRGCFFRRYRRRRKKEKKKKKICSAKAQIFATQEQFNGSCKNSKNNKKQEAKEKVFRQTKQKGGVSAAATSTTVKGKKIRSLCSLSFGWISLVKLSCWKKEGIFSFFCKPVLVQKELHRNHIFFIKVQIEITFFCCLIEIIRSKLFIPFLKVTVIAFQLTHLRFFFFFVFTARNFLSILTLKPFHFPFSVFTPSRFCVWLTDYFFCLVPRTRVGKKYPPKYPKKKTTPVSQC